MRCSPKLSPPYYPSCLGRGVGGGIIDGLEAVSDSPHATRCAPLGHMWLCQFAAIESVSLAGSQPAHARGSHTDTRFKRLRLQDLTSTEME